MLFDFSRFNDALRTSRIGRQVAWFETIDTTMRVAREQAEAGAVDGTIIMAEEQTAGVGRRGRSFQSPPGENLYFTVILRAPPELHARLPVVVPAAVCAAVRQTGVDARIKWPNDIWVGGKKLSGMLIDATSGPDGLVAYLGIGMNVNGDPTEIPEIRDIATSIANETNADIDREELLASVCNELERHLTMTVEALGEAYRSMSLILGQTVTVSFADATTRDGVAARLNDDGGLVVRDPAGEVFTVTAGEVSLRPAITARQLSLGEGLAPGPKAKPPRPKAR